MKTITRTIIVLAAAGLAARWFAASAEAQSNYTYTWADNAQGQMYLDCPVTGKHYWPSNTVWSQSVVIGGNCDNTGNVVSQPSNWNPVDSNTPALGAGVYPGGPGAVGVNVILDAPANTILDVANVTLNNLTLQTNGGLTHNQSLTANHIYLQCDGSITGIGGAGSTGHGGALMIASGGSLTKSGGAGTFSFGSGQGGVTLSGDNCSLIVQSGTLEMPFDAGNGGTFYNSTIALSNNTRLVFQAPDAANYEHAFIGTWTGTGAGTVLWNQGSIWCEGSDLNHTYHQGLTLNFPANMLQWSGGSFNSGPVTNVGVVNITNTGAWLNGVTLVNHGIVNFAPGSSSNLYGGGAILNNQADAVTYLLGDASITGNGQVYNYGLIRKTAGTGTSFIYPQYSQYSGTVEVDSGTLALNLNGNCYFTNATFVVSGGATLDFLISNITAQVEGTLRGSGSGTVLMNNGTISSIHTAILNFPGSMFQWQGGTFGGGGGNTVNADTLNLSGPGIISGWLTNNGTMIQSGSGSLNSAGYLQNSAGGVYNLQNDNSVTLGNLYNYGLLEKSAGTGTNNINAHLYNYGTITAGTGGLNFGGTLFNQNAGTFQLTPAFTFSPGQTANLNGGTISGVGTFGGNGSGDFVYVNGGVLAPGNPYGSIHVPCYFQIFGGALNIQLAGPSQFSQLAASNNVYLAGGTLNVALAGGYAPAIGTQFHILSCPSLTSAGFTTLNVPHGISVTYSNTGVYLTVTGAVPAQLTGPHVSGTNFMFGFGTVNNQSYSVYANTNLATTNWTFYTNLTGDGNWYQIVVPAQNPPRRFFRVRQP
jgi:hypothetical protein